MKTKWPSLLASVLSVSCALAVFPFLNACIDYANPMFRNQKMLPVSQRDAAACASNQYLQKFDCDFERIESDAAKGDPDAQYALGYLYYYGIYTYRDPQTGALWIGRAAAQGQPLAKTAQQVMLAAGIYVPQEH